MEDRVRIKIFFILFAPMFLTTSNLSIAMKDDVRENEDAFKRTRLTFCGFDGYSSEISEVKITSYGRRNVPTHNRDYTLKSVIFTLHIGDLSGYQGERQEGVDINTSGTAQDKSNIWSEPQTDWNYFYRITRTPYFDNAHSIFSFSLLEKDIHSNLKYTATIRHRSPGLGATFKFYNLKTQQYVNLGNLLQTLDGASFEETSFDISDYILAMKKKEPEELVPRTNHIISFLNPLELSIDGTFIKEMGSILLNSLRGNNNNDSR